jgi:elongator complex protein 3
MKPTRTLSGISSVTIFTKPYACSAACIFCPTQENVPKSYLKDEPGIQRALALDYDPYSQVTRRLEALKFNGHPTSKIELIVSGGTWDDYPLDYRYQFMCRVYQALNMVDFESEIPKDVDWNYLRNLQIINSESERRCTGCSIETRPDKINQNMLGELRRFGVTKIQIGIQSLHDEILLINARGHDSAKTIDAANQIRKEGFKIVAHWMCNLYKSTPEIDLEDFKMLFEENSVQPDELKIYPCSLLEGTILHKYYLAGKFEPYPEKLLVELLAECKTNVPIYNRISRLFRDIPSNNIVDGNKKTNLRELVQAQMKVDGTKCNCIRCREIQKIQVLQSDLLLNVFEYKTEVSKEYFLSYVTEDNMIAGFLRLAIYNDDVNIIKSRAMIREIHVYGQSIKVGGNQSGKAQHFGLGKLLILKAEELARENFCGKLAVIASVGTWEYYKARGFEIDKEYGYGVKQLIINNQ